MKWCGWTHERLRLYKQDNGYRLHMACHIDDVKAAYHLHQKYIYLRETLPETRQSAQPYDVWILANKTTGEILSGRCTCVANYRQVVVTPEPDCPRSRIYPLLGTLSLADASAVDSTKRIAREVVVEITQIGEIAHIISTERRDLQLKYEGRTVRFALWGEIAKSPNISVGELFNILCIRPAMILQVSGVQ
uniref:Uncharacterized protein n=1 Tax=Magallana gigas TaxID=29159 RepID=A0A8W8P0P0_MAGGI